ncbi:MAG: hypothetical protein ACRDRG_08680 [Pseudonocardiaceae bacterium]
MRKRSFFLVGGACLATLSLTMSTALADPANPAGPRLLPGVGSDTTQAVMNSYANGTTASDPDFGGVVAADNVTKIVASYDAVGSATITTKNEAACTNIPRPNGSTAGVNALAGLLAGFPADCAEWARSSNNDSANRAGQNLTYIPFALDGLTYATLPSSDVPRNLSLSTLQTIYRANVGDATCNDANDFQPLIPQAGSGTRAFWNTLVGPFGTCPKDVVGGTPVQEHDGRLLTNAKQLMPFGVGPWITQATTTTGAVRNGPAVLRGIGGQSPYDLADFPGARPLFNVVRTADVADPNFVRAFGTAAQGGQICAHPEVLEAHSLAPHPNCGSTAIVTPPN